jgi:hypothetical protein
MPDDEDGPDFSYAFAGAPQPHWNPAFRPDHHSPVKTTFDHAQLELPQTQLPDLEPAQDGNDDDEDEDEDELPTTSPIPTSHPPAAWTAKSHLMDKEPASDDSFFERYGPPEDPPSSPPPEVVAAPHAQHQDVHEAWEAIQQEPTATPLEEPELESYLGQEEEKEHPPAEPIPEEAPVEEQSEFIEPESASDLEHPEQAYEHQGEITTLEDAVQEDPEASLLANAETPAIETPAVEWAAQEDWNVGAQEQPSLSIEPEQTHVEEAAREQPSLGIDPEQTHVEEAAPEPLAPVEPDLEKSTPVQVVPELEPPSTVAVAEPELDWGASDDVDFGFGAIPNATEDDSSKDAGAPEASSGDTAPQQDDLAAIWSTAIDDDDDLLPEDAAAAFAFDDDGEGFLEDFVGQENVGSDMPGTTQAASTPTGSGHTRKLSLRYAPASAQESPPPAAPSNPYLPSGPQFTDLSQQRQAPTVNNAPVASPYAAAYQPPQPLRPQLQSGESFADKAKGGYHSPYDLPDDLAVTRRRPVQHHKLASPGGSQVQPPPRSSSMQSTPGLGPQTPQLPTSSMSARNFTPPSSSHSVQPPDGNFAQANQVARPDLKAVRSTSSGFFADLPVTQRTVRHATPSGRYTPGVNAAPTPPPGPVPPATNRSVSYGAPPQSYASQTQSAVSPLSGPQLQAPARLPPYAEDPNQARPATIPHPPSSSRYSPAVPSAMLPTKPTSFSAPAPVPVAVSAPPPSSSRYSPAPQPAAGTNSKYASQTGPPARTQSQQYAPRTSSPLAFHSMPHEQYQQSVAPPVGDVNHYQQDAVPLGRSTFDRAGSMGPPLEPVSENEAYGTGQPSQEESQRYPGAMGVSRGATPPPPSSRSGPPSSVSSPRRRSNYAPQSYQTGAPGADSTFAPPRRSQTSSPGAALKHPRMSMTSFDRPASAHGSLSPTKTSATLALPQPARRQSAYEESNLLAPQDEHAHDPLQRWRGAPILNWGIGNSVVTSFPQYAPRYGSGHVGPIIKPTAGVVHTRNANDVYPHSEAFTKFPGPLKKGKKKEVVAWLKASVESLQSTNQQMVLNGMLTAAMHTQREEKLLLWKVMTLLVEHDGALEGTPIIEEAVRKLISPSMSAENTAAETFGATQATPTSALPEAFDPAAVNVLRNHLYQGEREKAVWHAADQRLWAHALLIASTLNNKDLWKQVVQEFVRKEIRKIGDNTEALGALYQVFAGNWEESIDELVSVSARHGFNMVSTSTASATPTHKDALAGLDRWRETLLLILNNRSAGDAQALVALGKLLSGFGRAEAAHVCFLFAKNAAIFSGADDPNSHFSIVGGLPATQGSDFGNDLDTILLSEVYEFSFTLGSPALPPVPHLQAYKLYHAQVLAEMGRQTEAQQYADTIASIITSKSYRSPYYNKQLMGWVDELNQRLSQAPVDSSSSWKPSMDRVSTSLWGKFNTFIAGEDSDAASNGSANPPAAESGQFARLAGETPPMSRAVSNADMYGVYHANGSAVPAASSNSRYAPSNNALAPRTSLDQQRPRYDPQSQSSYQPRTSGESTRSTYEPRQSLDGGTALQRTASSNTYAANSSYAPSGPGFQSTPSVFSPTGSDTNLASSPYAASPYQGTPPNEPAAANSTYHSPPADHQQSTNGYQPSPPQLSSRFDSPAETPGYGYEQTSSAYEPPSYQPYQEDAKPWDADEPESPKEEKKPKKKSFMDDDDDDDEIIRRAAQLKAGPKSGGKADADRTADEAFLKAAEADGKFPNRSNFTSKLSNNSTQLKRTLHQKQIERAGCPLLAAGLATRRTPMRHKPDPSRPNSARKIPSSSTKIWANG